ncbi:MAG: hypothetical protein KAX49_14190 [Halanaerobiales bacterium]|nr:hypothetical protein [Halanaerobiales bacterium]
MVGPDQLKEVLGNNYSMQVFGIVPLDRDLYRIETDQGFKRLVRVQRKASRIRFSHSVIEALKDQGEEKLPVLTLTKTDEPYFKLENSNWIVLDWVNGRKPDLNKIQDIEQITRDLAKLHKNMNGVLPKGGSKVREKWDHWSKDVLHDLKFFKLFIAKIEKESSYSDFEEMILKNNEMIIQRLQQAKSLAYSKKCQKLIKKERKELGMIYQRINEKDLLFGFDGRIYFINPLWISYDVRVKDLGKWMERLIKKRPSLGKDIDQVVTWYEEERELNLGEKNWLLAFIIYPTKIMKVIERYYLHKKSWPEEGFVRKLRKALKVAEKEMEVYERLLIKFEGKVEL